MQLSHSRAAIEQAIAALRAGDAIEAERALRRQLLQQPDDQSALTKLAEIALSQHRLDEATVLLRCAAGLTSSPTLRAALVRHLLASSGPAAALGELETLPAAARHVPSMRVLEASLLGMLGHHEREITLYQELIAENARDSGLWVSLGNTLKTVGRTEEALHALRRAIDTKANNGEAYWSLANLKSFRFTAREFIAMRRTRRGKLTDGDRVHIEFALGKAYEDRKEFAQSFKHYAEGNRIRCAGLRPDQMGVTRFVDAVAGTFDRDLFARQSKAGCDKQGPIFVVGLHRSGSTLIEQILASHPLIEGAGELPVMQQLWNRFSQTAAQNGRSPFTELATSDRAVFRRLGEEYVERAGAFRRTDRPYFVDKLPANWLNVGLIRLILPNARIIDARRSPMACGFSNFKQHYAVGVYYSCSLSSIGQFYRDYLRLMTHFDAVQPASILHVLNERLIENPEGEVRRMLNHVGLPFNAACLDFHNNPRPVNTPSADQVRRAINRDGVDAWKPYERWLGPLKEALGPAMYEWIPALPVDA